MNQVGRARETGGRFHGNGAGSLIRLPPPHRKDHWPRRGLAFFLLAKGFHPDGTDSAERRRSPGRRSGDFKVEAGLFAVFLHDDA
jgi:hypothetical protein